MAHTCPVCGGGGTWRLAPSTKDDELWVKEVRHFRVNSNYGHEVRCWKSYRRYQARGVESKVRVDELKQWEHALAAWDRELMGPCEGDCPGYPTECEDCCTY